MSEVFCTRMSFSSGLKATLTFEWTDGLDGAQVGHLFCCAGIISFKVFLT